MGVHGSFESKREADLGGCMSKINNLSLYNNLKGQDMQEMKHWNRDDHKPFQRRYDDWKYILDSVLRTREGYAK